MTTQPLVVLAPPVPAFGSAPQLAESTIRLLLRNSGIPLMHVLDLVKEESQSRSAADLVLEYDPALAWKISTTAGDLAKPAIEIRSGPSASTEEISGILNVSPQTIRNRVEAGELIYYPAARGKGWRFPHWQIVNNDSVQSWVPELIKAYGGNGWGLVDFLTVPRTPLNGLNYLAHIQQGPAGIADVIEAAKRSNPD